MNLEKLLQNECFSHVYQPIYHLDKWGVLGIESFFRSEFYANPEHVFQLAKKTNNLYKLDTQSIFKSISKFYNHHKMNDKLLFVNVFPSTLLNPGFFSFLDDLLKQVTITCDQIILEINEEEKVEDMRSLCKVVSDLRSYGFLIAIDDMGKGESALPKIIELEPDFIKLDRYFSTNLSDSNKKQQFIQLLLNFSNSYSQIILEGIEKPEDLAMAKALGIPFVQGFLLGKPEEIEGLEEKLMSSELLF